MRPFVRVLAVLVVVPSVFFFVYWLPCSVLSLHAVPFLAGLVSLLCAVLAGRCAWRTIGAADNGLVASVATGALLVGGIGFAGGFFGPLLWAPDANTGPLLGLFITGPLGFLLGGLGGAFRWSVARRRAGS
jgi:hypothetical protein